MSQLKQTIKELLNSHLQLKENLKEQFSDDRGDLSFNQKRKVYQIVDNNLDALVNSIISTVAEERQHLSVIGAVTSIVAKEVAFTHTHTRNGLIPVCIQFLSTPETRHGIRYVPIRVLDDIEAFAFSKVDGQTVLFPGDLGMPGYSYDSRAIQVFNTRESCLAAISRWGDKHPNFIDDYGRDLSQCD